MIFDLSDEDRHLIAVALFERVKQLMWVNSTTARPDPNLIFSPTHAEITRLRAEASRCSARADMISPNAKKEDDGK
jgi:hypothetical protein